ncbi:MAG TPA: phospholipase D-like domain-containing protein [Vicinamibacterales bacterium]|nr:phospholipase D-like domain-containing protein [Vicinamibacterales bacterium]
MTSRARKSPVPAGPPDTRVSLRAAAEQALSRAAGAPLVAGNDLRVLRDAVENYPAWDAAIDRAQTSIHVEMYIIERDAIGRRFVERLASRARDGVTVRLLYDWFGCGTGPALGLFRPLVRAGGQVRAFNRPALGAALGWVRRNHRKLIAVDGRIAFISGLCVSVKWEGDARRGLEPWRDTGVVLTGPAVAHAETAFADTWRHAGGVLDDEDLPAPCGLEPAGAINVRIVATAPFTASMLRLDLLMAALARESLWITDAYFVDHGPYVSSLRRAAEGGVDVRLLLPRDSDLGWTVTASRTLYRSLLEVGVRIFEWNGAMIHAKTAVVDGRWARIGSSNLNLTSWITNWEIDVAVEDRGVGATLQAHFDDDLARATEIVLKRGRRTRNRSPAPVRVRARGSMRRVARTMSGVGRSMGAAVIGSRPLADFEFVPLLAGGCLLVGVAALAWWQPQAFVWPLAALAAWTGITLLIDAVLLLAGGRRP